MLAPESKDVSRDISDRTSELTDVKIVSATIPAVNGGELCEVL